MRYLLRLCIIVILLGSLVNPFCIDRWPCRCSENADNTFVMQCEDNVRQRHPAFNITYKPYIYLTISCSNSPLWWFRNQENTVQLPSVASIIFKHCGFRRGNTTMNEIIGHFVQGDVNELDFQTFYDSASNTPFRRAHFANLTHIVKLVFSNNYLTEVSFDLFHDLINLKHLNISHNLLEKIPNGFLDLPHLIDVDLSHNKLELIDSGLFSGLRNLRNLRLEFNHLTELPPLVFNNLTSLVNLNVAGNNLKQLQTSIFKNLELLADLDLSYNNFSVLGISPDVFQNNKKLESILLTNNKEPLETLPDGIFHGLDHLHTVYLNDNKMEKIPEDLLVGVTNILEIVFSGNKIKEIPLHLFNDSHWLSILSFRDNKITDLPIGIFRSAVRLRTLDLSKNQLKEINTKALEDVRLVRTLNFAYNQIERIYGGINCDSLPGFCLRFVDRVYLNNNRLETVPNGWLPSDRLRILALDNNAIKKISIADFESYKGVPSISYANNQIETISFSGFEDFRTSALQVQVSVGNNPINCDCKMLDLLKYRDSTAVKHHKHPILMDIQGTHCAKPRELQSTPLRELNGTSLQCLIEDPSTLNADCPQNCQCWDRPEVKMYRIDCSYRNLTVAPEFLQAPKGYYIELNLAGNLIKNMPFILQSGYQNVTKLDLSNNLISDVHLDSVSENLETLILNSNQLTKLEPLVLRRLGESTKLMHLELYDNPWVCNCETVDFLEFVQSNFSFSADLRNVTCDSLNYPIFQMTTEDICHVSVTIFIIIMSIIAILGIVVALIATIYHMYEREIKVWLYAKQWCLWFVTEDELDKDKEYDAFISFSHMDDELVTRTLVPTLEEGSHPYRLCVHYRDWIPGESIPSQIVQSVDSSKRTIIVLSQNFLKSVWSRIEFRTAHEQALSEGRARVIIVLLEDIGPIDDLDSELQAYLKMNTYVKWGDPWFWQKLKYALPHSDYYEKKEKSELRTIELSGQVIKHSSSDKIADTNFGTEIR